nr:MAG TPA: hypothetical protein [Caudoviricetes sp.]
MCIISHSGKNKSHEPIIIKSSKGNLRHSRGISRRFDWKARPKNQSNHTQLYKTLHSKHPERTFSTMLCGQCGKNVV